MKKILLALGLALSLTASAFAQSGDVAWVWTNFDLLNGQQVVVSNNSTINYNYTNIPFINPLLYVVLSLTSSNVVYTNVSSGSNITNTFQYPAWYIDAPLGVDGNGLVMSNISLTIVYNYTNIYFPKAMPNQIANFGFNTSGALGSGGIVSNGVYSGPTVTNYLDIAISNNANAYTTFNFQKSGLDTNYYDSNTNDYLSIGFAAVSNGGVFFTNINATTLAGARFLRLAQISQSNLANCAGIIVDKVVISYPVRR